MSGKIKLGKTYYTHHGYRKTVYEQTWTYFKWEPARWVESWVEYRKQNDGTWRRHEPHKFTWARVPQIIVSVRRSDDSADVYPVRATFRLSAREYISRFGDDLWDAEMISFGRDEVLFRRAWKKVTIAIVNYMYNHIPEPLEGLRDIARPLFDYFTDSFYDFLFSIEL